MEELNNLIKKNALTNGLIVGVIGAVLSVVSLYLLVSASAMSIIIGAGVVSVLLIIVIDVLFTLDLRKKIGGFWNFKQAVTGIFIMLFVAYIVSTAVTQLFTRVVEPDMQARMLENISSVTTTMMENQGVPQDKIEAQQAETQKKIDEARTFTAARFAKDTGIAILLTFVFSLILAAIFKKEAPLFLDNEAIDE